MALGRAFSVAVQGVAGEIVEIEADITSGLPGVHLVGLPDAALQESRDRVRAAIMNCGNRWPMSRLTLALSPATLPKMGSVYDVALAAAVLSADRKVSPGRGQVHRCGVRRHRMFFDELVQAVSAAGWASCSVEVV